MRMRRPPTLRQADPGRHCSASRPRASCAALPPRHRHPGRAFSSVKRRPNLAAPAGEPGKPTPQATRRGAAHAAGTLRVPGRAGPFTRTAPGVWTGAGSDHCRPIPRAFPTHLQRSPSCPRTPRRDSTGRNPARLRTPCGKTAGRQPPQPAPPSRGRQHPGRPRRRRPRPRARFSGRSPARGDVVIRRDARRDRRPLGWLLEGMMTAQVASVLARLGVADELADGPLTAGQLAPPGGRRARRTVPAAVRGGRIRAGAQGRRGAVRADPGR